MRAITFRHTNADLLRVLFDVRSMVCHLVKFNLKAEHRSALALRKETTDWFRVSWRSRYAAHYHHSVCSMAVGICRAYWQLRRQRARARLPPPSPPSPDRLVVRLDQTLFRIKGGALDVTVRPDHHLQFALTDAMKHKRWTEWSSHKMGELTLTPRTVCIAFQVPELLKVEAPETIGLDLNLRHADGLSTDGEVVRVDLSVLARIQQDGQKRREGVQRAIPQNLKKQRLVLRRCRGRQQNRTLDHIRKVVAPAIVAAAGGRNVAFEDLTAKEQMVVKGPSKDLRRKLSRWATGLIQREVEQRSPARVVRVNPRGTSSECPRCGGKVSHPEWRRTRCATCGEFDRDLGAGSIVLSRGLALLGRPPLTATARASLAEWCKVAPHGLTPDPMKRDAGTMASGEMSTNQRTEREQGLAGEDLAVGLGVLDRPRHQEPVVAHETEVSDLEDRTRRHCGES